VIYRVTITRDAEGRLILRRFLTGKPQVDLRSIRGKLNAGESYFWRVEAYSDSGRLILIGARNSFMPKTARSAEEKKVAQRAKGRYPDIASLTLPPLPQPPLAQLEDAEQNFTDQIVSRSPSPDQTVNDTHPVITVEFKTAVNASDLSLVIDDTDVTAMAQIAGNRITFKSALALAAGQHQITLTSGAGTVNWNFDVGAPATAGSAAADPTAATPGTDAEAEAPADNGAADPNTAANQNQFNYEATSNTQAVSRAEAETNDLSLSAQGAYANGPWRAEMNGSGVINSVFGPKPRHMLGRFSDYVFRLTRQAPESRWGADASFGMIAPQMHLGAEFINTGFPREGVEASFKL
jgi:hypothetical protein